MSRCEGEGHVVDSGRKSDSDGLGLAVMRQVRHFPDRLPLYGMLERRLVHALIGFNGNTNEKRVKLM